MSDRQISVRKLILNDYFALLLTIGGPIVLVVAGLTAATGFIPRMRGRGGQQVPPEFITAACSVAIVVAGLLVWLLFRRIADIRRIMSNGPRATGRVLSADFYKDRGRIEFEFDYEGSSHTTGAAVMKNALTTAMIPGTEVALVLDPDNPKRALIEDLYSA